MIPANAVLNKETISNQQNKAKIERKLGKQERSCLEVKMMFRFDHLLTFVQL